MLVTLGKPVRFKVRGCQHLGVSEWTGRPLTGGNPTAVTKHIRSKKCGGSLEDFSIIGREHDFHLRLLKESLFIKFHDYELNKQQSSIVPFLTPSVLVQCFYCYLFIIFLIVIIIFFSLTYD